MNNNLKDKRKIICYVIFGIILILLAVFTNFIDNSDVTNEIKTNVNIKNEIDLENTSNTINNINEIPEYSGKLIITINNNVPFFTENDFIEESFIKFSDLDKKGRCGVAIANISKNMLPGKGEKRDNLNKVIPTGWDNDAEYKKSSAWQ